MNKEVLIDQHEVENKKPKELTSFFIEKRIELQKAIGNNQIQKTIAEDYLGISTEQLRKKINKNKPLTRDWLIAICAAHGLDDAETTDALIICNMPTLDDGSTREQLIVNFLRNHKGNPVKISVFNDYLRAAKVDPLEISHRQKKNESELADSDIYPYKETHKRVVKTYQYEGDQYNSLITEYIPNMKCVAVAFLTGDDGKEYVLESHSNGHFIIYEEGKDELPDVLEELDVSHVFYKTLIELELLSKERKQYLDSIIFDSKNYKGRYSAKIKNDSLYVFYEEYNYYMPERNEYYMMEYIEGKYILSISHDSMFMKLYLSEEKYQKYYSYKKECKRLFFDSIEAIEEYYSSKSMWFYPDLIRDREHAYKRFKKIIDEKIELIRKKQVYIQNISYIYDREVEVLSFYKIEDCFHCKYDDYGEIYDADDFAIIYDKQGTPIEISFDEIKQAFELGINDIEDICRIKEKYGRIESLLK